MFTQPVGQDLRLLAHDQLSVRLRVVRTWPRANVADEPMWDIHQLLMRNSSDAYENDHHSRKASRTEARRSLQTSYRPQVLYAGGTDEALPALDHRLLGGLNIFVCEDGACELPVTSAEEAVQAVAARRR